MIKKTAIAAGALAMVAATSACEPGTGPSSNQAAGALAGAAIGAAAGTLVGGDDRRNALVGAGIGLLAGAAVGTYLDEQERQLNQDLAGTGADVRRVDDKLYVTMPADVTFDVDSSQIKPRFRPTLNNVAQTLKAYPSSYVDVIGHTDSTGDADYNMRLSRQRAEAVANALIRRGVRPARIVTRGMGETQPIASNSTPQGRQANRRVEIVITPAT